VRDRENGTDLARTLIHEYAHALLHFDADDDSKRSKREVKAEAVAYVVAGTAGSTLAGRRSTGPRGSRTIPRSFASGSDGSVGRQKNSLTSSKTDSHIFVNQQSTAFTFGVWLRIKQNTVSAFNSKLETEDLDSANCSCV